MPRVSRQKPTVATLARVGALEPEPEVSVTGTRPRSHQSDSEDFALRRQRLSTVLENEIEQILPILRWYVVRSGLGGGGSVAAVALEVLSETTVIAFTKAREQELPMELVPWLLRIGLNIVKRQVAATAKLAYREPSAERRASMHADSLVSEVYDLLFDHSATDPADDLASKDEAQRILSLVSPEDQRLLLMAKVYDMDPRIIARELGVKPIAARVRVHRAVARLREAWNETTTQGDSNATR